MRYRLLADKLNKKEQYLFLQQLVGLCGIKLILTLIFEHFSKPIINCKPYDKGQLDKIINIISNIIHSRQESHDPFNLIEISLCLDINIKYIIIFTAK